MKWIALALTIFAGCSYSDRGGTRHTLILGFGIVTISNQNTATITSTTGIGLKGSSWPVGGSLGYFHETWIEVRTNLILELKQ